jgi:HEAT repeat protein
MREEVLEKFILQICAVSYVSAVYFRHLGEILSGRKGRVNIMHQKNKAMSKSCKIAMIILVISFCLLPIGYLQAANFDELVQQVKSEDLIVRLHATKALGETRDARAVEPLIANLKDEKCGCTSANALVKIGKPAVEPLITALKDENPIVRRNAAVALGKIKDASAVNPLITALKDENPIVRRNAAVALGEIKDTSAAEPLTAALKDESPIVRKKAATALKEMGKPETAVVDILY